jgi:hypothetical protein
MLKRRRSLRAAACAPLIAAALAIGAAGAVSAQDTNSVVGPPQLKDFQLPGQRTTPPATTPPAPQPQPSAPTRTAPPAAAPAPRRETPVRPVEHNPPRAAPERIAPAPRAAPPPAPTTQQPQPASPLPSPVPAPPPVAQPSPAPAVIPSSTPAFNWLWLLLLVPAMALGGLAWLRLRRRREARDGEDRASLAGTLGVARWVENEAPAAEPVPAEPEPEPEPAAQPARAWLEIDIAPDRAAATESQAVLHYELTLRNTGELAARNIRIDSRLFNASADADIADFLAGPIHDLSGSPQIAIPPGEELRLGSASGMAKEEVQAIEVQGRTIFVPSLATKVAYDWDGGAASGRTARAWLVGRETEASTKMGPFRLDLGPRIYRQVGRRETKAAMA